MAGDRRGSQVQGPGTKTEAVICLGEQDRATQDQHRHHRPGRRGQGTKGPKSRSSSLARVSARPHPPQRTRMTASSSQRRHKRQHECDRPKGHKTYRFVTKSQHPRAQASGARRRLRSTIPPSCYNQWQTGMARTANDASLQPVANRNGTHHQRCVALSGPGKPDRPHRLQRSPMRFVSRWPGRYSEARQPRSKGGPEAQRHNHDESKGHCTRSRKESY